MGGGGLCRAMCGARSHAPSCMQLAAAVAANHAQTVKSRQQPACWWCGSLARRWLHDGWWGPLQGHVWCEEPCSIMHAAGCCCGCPSCTVEKDQEPAAAGLLVVWQSCKEAAA